jgi:hypothetical protein
MNKVFLVSALIAIQLATCFYWDKFGTTFLEFSGRHHEVALNKAFRDGGKIEAEGVGFEPTVGFPRHRFSRPEQSAALPPLRFNYFPF